MEISNSFPRYYSNPEWCRIQIYRTNDSIVLKLNKFLVPLYPGTDHSMESEDHPILGKVILDFYPLTNTVYVNLFGEIIPFTEDPQ